jgi:hypothetical protein
MGIAALPPRRPFPAMTGAASRLLQPHLLVRRRPRKGVDLHQRRVCHPRPDATRPEVVVDRRKPCPLVQDFLNLVQQRLTLLGIRC